MRINHAFAVSSLSMTSHDQVYNVIARFTHPMHSTGVGGKEEIETRSKAVPEVAAVVVVALLAEEAQGKVGDEVDVVALMAPPHVLAVMPSRPCICPSVYAYRRLLDSAQTLPNMEQVGSRFRLIVGLRFRVQQQAKQ